MLNWQELLYFVLALVGWLVSYEQQRGEKKKKNSWIPLDTFYIVRNENGIIQYQNRFSGEKRDFRLVQRKQIATARTQKKRDGQTFFFKSHFLFLKLLIRVYLRFVILFYCILSFVLIFTTTSFFLSPQKQTITCYYSGSFMKNADVGSTVRKSIRIPLPWVLDRCARNQYLTFFPIFFFFFPLP